MATETIPRTTGTSRQAPGRTAPPGSAPAPARGQPRGSGPRTPDRTAPGRTAAPRDPGTRPVSAPRHTRPIIRPATEPAARRRIRPRHPRAPFILLLVGLLGGALVSLLVISTTLAQGSFQITTLQQQNANLQKQEQLLNEQVAQASSPAQIAQEAEQLGMRQNPDLQFIDLKTRKIVSGKVSPADAEIDVPGYTP